MASAMNPAVVVVIDDLNDTGLFQILGLAASLSEAEELANNYLEEAFSGDGIGTNCEVPANGFYMIERNGQGFYTKRTKFEV